MSSAGPLTPTSSLEVFKDSRYVASAEHKAELDHSKEAQRNWDRGRILSLKCQAMGSHSTPLRGRQQSRSWRGWPEAVPLGGQAGRDLGSQ